MTRNQSEDKTVLQMKFKVDWTVPNVVFPTRFIDEFGKTVNNGKPNWTICGGFRTVEAPDAQSAIRQFEQLLDSKYARITASPV